MTENIVVGRWINERLLSSPLITTYCLDRIYSCTAPINADAPYIVYTLAGSDDVRGNGGILNINVSEYQISLIVDKRVNDETLLILAEEIDRLFDVQCIDIIYHNVYLQGSHRIMQYEASFPTDINETKFMYASRYIIRSRRN